MSNFIGALGDPATVAAVEDKALLAIRADIAALTVALQTMLDGYTITVTVKKEAAK
jgi:hypothetical protein